MKKAKSNNGKYVDGFVLVVPKANRNKYKKMAEEGKKLSLKLGALDYKECVMEDAKPMGMPTNFIKMAKPKANEEVWFSFITFKSRAHRDAVNKKVWTYYSKKYANASFDDMPFDMKRMAHAGFKVIVG